jgi:hypothetical protein
MPEPVLVAIAAAIAGKSAGTLYDLVKRKFRGKRDAETVLDAAEGAPVDSAEVAALSEELAAADRSDPEFSSELRSTWQEMAQAGGDGVVNQISGTVSGKVVQARDIEGGVSF